MRLVDAERPGGAHSAGGAVRHAGVGVEPSGCRPSAAESPRWTTATATATISADGYATIVDGAVTWAP
ncbi:hypothetical protein KZZ52_36080 [Dactylosporangium sp. AC04546]|uniref:hypothetical protein n=1 Tax=Dactylosporangium sp. AC04546 TaxID=2862460 RepID=UPI001EE11CDD|nr:hypothetical protein [Dactylosporangium sp. AC04546]WVK79387.1 hypothetical protein KZZ52_36080 [Dactylosporangium sp. AC04546]